MDDRRFDSLVKSLASGVSRRSVLKGLIGLGGAAATAGSAIDGDIEAARRPASTPTPIPKCPGRQIWSSGACVCPGSLAKCGPDCCNPTASGASHSECCDNECCFGHCYGEELCCPWPDVFCAVNNECCTPDKHQCCGSQGCCEQTCCPAPNGASLCCEGDTPYCCGDGCCSAPCCEDPSGSSVCCDGEGETCCADGACIPAGGCCADSDCGEATCWSCVNHVCAEDQSKCAGCLDCVGGTCVPVDANCDDPQAPCASKTCGADGTCTTVLENDCRKTAANGDLLCPCVPSNECNDSVCNQTTGACEETFDCAKLGVGEDNCCSFPGDPCLTRGLCSDLTDESWLNPYSLLSCTYDVVCSDDCCDEYFGTECGDFGLCVRPEPD